jgi:hypothetical protein
MKDKPSMELQEKPPWQSNHVPRRTQPRTCEAVNQPDGESRDSRYWLDQQQRERVRRRIPVPARASARRRLRVAGSWTRSFIRARVLNATMPHTTLNVPWWTMSISHATYMSEASTSHAISAHENTALHRGDFWNVMTRYSVAAAATSMERPSPACKSRKK